MIIGVVGKSGAGKNKVASYLESKGFNQYDFDKYAHFGLEANKLKLQALFGRSVVDPNGKINRRKLGNIVFSSPIKLRQLERVIWPWIDEEISETIQGDAVLNAALLHTSKLVDKCDLVFYVYTPIWIRVRRLIKRDNRSILEILKRLNNQKEINRWQYKKPIIIWNIKEEKLYKQIDKALLNS